MLRVASLSLIVAMAFGTLSVQAEEVESGLKPGQFVGAFYVEKCAGAEDDGVDIGKNLCYRCKYGGRPQVMVFARTTDEKLAKLVQELDKAVAQNSDQQLRAFVNLLGDDKAQLKEEAAKFGATSKSKNVPIVVPNEFENGPADYGINPKADVTVILAAGGQVKANRAFSAGQLDSEAVLADIKKILN